MSNIKRILTAILENNTYQKRFLKRLQEYPCVSTYVPRNYAEIACDYRPWYCHGLAFRMATYSEYNESLFRRLNTLLELAENTEGWSNEKENIGTAWSKRYDEFFHVLWMLQCVEYFKCKNAKVVFAAKPRNKSPDLIVYNGTRGKLYVECYVHSKWWFRETFIEDIVGLVDGSLSLERVYNTRQNNLTGKMSTILEEIAGIITSSKLETARKRAAIESPYTIYNRYGIKLLMKGEGEYQADSKNAHGDQAKSAKVYIREIIRKKKRGKRLAKLPPKLSYGERLGH